MAQDFYQTFASIDKSLESIASAVFQPTMVKQQEAFMGTNVNRKAGIIGGSLGTQAGGTIFAEMNKIIENTNENTKEGDQKILAALEKQITVLENIDDKQSKEDAVKLRELVDLTNKKLSKIEATDGDKKLRQAGSLSKVTFAAGEKFRELREGKTTVGKSLMGAAKAGFKAQLGFGADEEVDPKEFKRRATGAIGRGLLHAGGIATGAPGANLGALYLGSKEKERRAAYGEEQQRRGAEATRVAEGLFGIENMGGFADDSKNPIGFNTGPAKSQRVKDFENFEGQTEEKQAELIKGLFKDGISVKLDEEDWKRKVLAALNALDTNMDSAFADDQQDEMESKLAFKKKDAQAKIDKVPEGSDPGVIDALTDIKEGQDSGIMGEVIGEIVGNNIGRIFKGPLGNVSKGLQMIPKAISGVSNIVSGAISGIGSIVSGIGLGTVAAGLAAAGAVAWAGYELYDNWDTLTGEGGMSESEVAESQAATDKEIFGSDKKKAKGITNREELGEYNNLQKDMLAQGKMKSGDQYTLQELRDMKAGKEVQKTLPQKNQVKSTEGKTTPPSDLDKLKEQELEAMGIDKKIKAPEEMKKLREEGQHISRNRIEAAEERALKAQEFKDSVMAMDKDEFAELLRGRSVQQVQTAQAMIADPNKNRVQISSSFGEFEDENTPGMDRYRNSTTYREAQINDKMVEAQRLKNVADALDKDKYVTGKEVAPVQEQIANATATPVRDVATKAKESFEASPTAAMAATEASEKKKKEAEAATPPPPTGGGITKTVENTGASNPAPKVETGDKSFASMLFGVY